MNIIQAWGRAIKPNGVLLGALFALSACGFAATGEQYPVAVTDVREKLLQTDVPFFLFSDANVVTRVVNSGGDEVQWTVVNRQNVELLRFAAQLTPEGDGTRVVVAVRPPSGPMNTVISERLLANPDIVDVYEAAMTEQIDAKLEGRTFDTRAIAGQLAVAARNQIPDVIASVSAQADENAKRNRHNIERAYADEAAGREPRQVVDLE